MENIICHCSTAIQNRPNGIGQDYIFSCELMNEIEERNYYAIVVADGHGSNEVIHAIRQMTNQMSFLLSRENPIIAIYEELQNQIYCTKNSGATISIVFFYPATDTHCGEIYVQYMGDSQIRIYCDETEVYASELHVADNPDEIRRLTDKHPHHLSLKYLADTYMLPKTPNLLGPIKKSRVRIMDDNYHVTSVIPTMVLGHRDMFLPKEIDSPTLVYTFVKGMNVKVIIASDGFWDMYLATDTFPKDWTATEYVDFAYNRWTQLWMSQQPDGVFEMVNYGDNYDDISVGILRSG